MSSVDPPEALRLALRDYIESRAMDTADTLLNASLTRIAVFDFEQELADMVDRELKRWIREGVTATFRGVLKDPSLHATALEVLRDIVERKGE